jgi:hypothetical protein
MGGLPSTFGGNAPGFGQSGGPGFISPFDQSQFTGGAAQSIAAMTNQYQNLGLGAVPAGTTGPASGGAPGIPGSGVTPHTPGGFGAGSTAYQMDVGARPSTTGGIPTLFEAGLGTQQTQDLGSTISSAQSAIRGKNQQTGLIPTAAGVLGSVL